VAIADALPYIWDSQTPPTGDKVHASRRHPLLF